MFLSSPLRIKQITRLFVANKRLVIGAANFTSKTIKIVQKWKALTNRPSPPVTSLSADYKDFN